MITEKYIIEEKEIIVFLPDDYSENKIYSVLYFHDGRELEKYIQDINLTKHIIVGITSKNRLHDLTPWKANAIVSKFNDFGGFGKAYLDFIIEILMPFINNKYSTFKDTKNTSIGGISLGGLISCFSIYQTSIFGNIIGISGSFWYPNWLNFIENNKILNNNINIFLISGKNEGNSKPFPLNKTGEFTSKTYNIFKKNFSGDINLIWDNGSHHSNRESRIKKSLIWLLNL